MKRFKTLFLHIGLGKTGTTSVQQDILARAGVAVTPGLDFDKGRGAQKLRFSYARATEDIVEGLERLERYMRALGHID